MKHLAGHRKQKLNAFFRSFSSILPIFSQLHTLNKCALVMLFKEKYFTKLQLPFALALSLANFFAFLKMSGMDGVVS